MAALTRLVHLNPLHVNGLTQLGSCYVQFHQYNRAVELYELALKVDPHRPLTLFNLGRLLPNKYAIAMYNVATQVLRARHIGAYNL